SKNNLLRQFVENRFDGPDRNVWAPFRLREERFRRTGIPACEFFNRPPGIPMPSDMELRNLISQLNDPAVGLTLSQLKMVARVESIGESVAVLVELPTHAYPAREALSGLIESAVKAADPGIKLVEVSYSVKTKGKES